jgi:hypothetical protein
VTAEREYTNGRIRVRPEQIDYLDGLLHTTWVARAQERAVLREQFGAKSELARLVNSEMRLIQTIQEEVRRTREDMGL